MDNGKVQTNLRTSKIRKGISRTLSTAAFESVVIHDEIKEEVTWSSLEERDRKVANWEMLLIQSFKQLHEKVLEELDLSHKRAHFKNNKKETRPIVHNKAAKPADNISVKQEHELDDLDGLDTL